MMEERRLIPSRPADDESRIPAADKDMIAYAVAFGVPNPKAFALWHPEFLDGSGKLNKTGRAACTQFFSYAKNREYADAYRRTLAEFLERKNSDVSIGAELSEDRIDNAYKNLLRLAIEDLERGGGVDNDTYKLYMELFKKLGRFKDDAEEQEAPRRYLPERCSSCAYRSFVESHVESGGIVNECDFCRTRRFAEENGWRFDATRNLDLPPEGGDGGAKAPEPRQK